MSEKSIEIDSSPPSLPGGDEELDVYTRYAVSLDDFGAKYNDAVQTICLCKQGHVAWLRGKAMLLAKDSGKVKLNWEEIFEAHPNLQEQSVVHALPELATHQARMYVVAPMPKVKYFYR